MGGGGGGGLMTGCGGKMLVIGIRDRLIDGRGGGGGGFRIFGTFYHNLGYLIIIQYKKSGSDRWNGSAPHT